MKYLHYFGNESSESLLEAYGIVTRDQKQSDVLKYKQCPNCSEPNNPDSKFCAKCRMVLTYDAYSETLESEKQQNDKLTNVEAQMKSMQSQLQNILSVLGSGSISQEGKQEIAKRLIEQGVYKKVKE